MSIAKLVIYPVETNYAPDDIQVLVQALAEIEFIGEQFIPPGQDQDNQLRYLVGQQFLKYMTFLGCSPAIEIEPQENGSEDFCHIVISPVNEKMQFCADAAGKGPRCPHCRHEEKDWQYLVSKYHENISTEYRCPECQQVTPLLKMNWRKSAVAARVFIDIYSVFPHEAVLADKVLQQLEQKSGVAWRYFYHR